MPSRRSGMTLIEILVVVALIGLLIALVLPAIQSSRESARRTSCRNNLHQIGTAILNSESQRGVLPGLYNGTFLPQPRSALDEFHFHSWRTVILAQLEQAVVYNALNQASPVTTAPNATAFSAKLAVFACPSTSNYNDSVPDISEWNNGAIPVRKAGIAARSDYEAIGGVQVRRQAPSSSADLSIIQFGPWGEPTYDVASGASLRYRKARLVDIADGLSNTVLVSERAGRPDIYVKGERDYPYPYSDPNHSVDHHQAAWAISTHFWWLVYLRNQPINQSNYAGYYSFHPGGAHAALADGSVRFLKESTSPAILTALVTRSGLEVVGAE
jgi:prepilin-type N-terminal cleavage/methylation domain-containing protein/prepilin-type processing-associated H-X9-DG protein